MLGGQRIPKNDEMIYVYIYISIYTVYIYIIYIYIGLEMPSFFSIDDADICAWKSPLKGVTYAISLVYVI